ncbi:hypothetical protein SAY86_003026 [Trapa natans]|uniref:Histidine-containing phosphotransfer protein n=1 Tax=Trapa natans TaxID=22666 RepID=A0AAN7LUN8_TRANT|nr:hypothetical protein SAY86_003026 [Trapa natans]
MDSEAVKKWKAELIEEGILDEEFFTEFENIYKNNPDGIAKKITRLLETMESELRKVARYQKGLPGDFDKSMGALLAVRMASVSIGSKKIMTKTEEMSEFDREETDKWSDARRELKRALAELEIHMDTYLTGILDEECFTELENIYENDPDGIAKRITGMLEMMNSDLRMLSRCQTEVPTNLDEAVSILASLEVASLSIGCKKMMTKIDEMTGIDEAERDKWHGVRREMKRALAELEIHMDTYLTVLSCTKMNNRDPDELQGAAHNGDERCSMSQLYRNPSTRNSQLKGEQEGPGRWHTYQSYQGLGGQTELA